MYAEDVDVQSKAVNAVNVFVEQVSQSVQVDALILRERVSVDKLREGCESSIPVVQEEVNPCGWFSPSDGVSVLNGGEMRSTLRSDALYA